MPLLTATFAWGYGNVGYGPSRLWAILRNNNPDHIERTLTEAVEALSSEGTEAAYSVLRPWRANVVWGFGPAFLSKFLYFVIWKMDVPGPKPLILDAQVAASIRLIAEPVYTRAPIDQDMASWLWPTSNWWAHRYSQYIHLVHRVASLFPSDIPSRPDVLELALFDGRLRTTGVWDLI